MKETINDLLTLQGLELQPGSDETLIAELRLRIPAPILGHYDRLRVRGKKGVAIARNGVCIECHMRIPIGVLATLTTGADIQLCSCGRYLFLPVALPASAAPVAEKKHQRKTRKKKTASPEPGPPTGGSTPGG